MSIIDLELDELKKLCENAVPNSKIIALIAAPPAPLVRVDIRENQAHRQLTACLRFPEAAANADEKGRYPHLPLLIELKSRTLSSRFLDKLTESCDAKVREKLGERQCLHVLTYLQQYLHKNTLCVCYDEIQTLLHELAEECDTTTRSELKLKQSTALVKFRARGGVYFYYVHATVPNDYPNECVELQTIETNLPPNLRMYLKGQSREIARQCCEPPLRLTPAALAAFKAKPSLYKALHFCLAAMRDFPAELCPVCDAPVLPAQAEHVELDDSKDAYVERVYCGHLFHQGCLKRYLQEPPFPKDGKLCPAKCRHLRSDRSYGFGGSGSGGKKPPPQTVDADGICGIRLAHDRWVVSVNVAEQRWAKKQARDREFEEVRDFMNFTPTEAVTPSEATASPSEANTPTETAKLR